MEAPDKIYVHEVSAIELAEPVLKEYHIEYIREDALLEWLKKEYETMAWYYEKMKHVTGCTGDSYGKAEAYKKVIDKIESL